MFMNMISVDNIKPNTNKNRQLYRALRNQTIQPQALKNQTTQPNAKQIKYSIQNIYKA